MCVHSVLIIATVQWVGGLVVVEEGGRSVITASHKSSLWTLLVVVEGGNLSWRLV